MYEKAISRNITTIRYTKVRHFLECEVKILEYTHLIYDVFKVHVR